MAAEKEFENQVKRFLKEQHCWVLKTWSNGIQREGVPDLLVCCNSYFLGAEIKAPNGKPSPLQLFNVKLIRNSGGIAVVLYPDQFEAFKALVMLLKTNQYESAYEMQFEFDERRKSK